MIYEPKITFEPRPYPGPGERKDNIWIWVNAPDGTLFCIWDLPKSALTDDVKYAIVKAFNRGMLCRSQQVALAIGKYVEPAKIGEIE